MDTSILSTNLLFTSEISKKMKNSKITEPLSYEPLSNLLVWWEWVYLWTWSSAGNCVVAFKPYEYENYVKQAAIPFAEKPQNTDINISQAPHASCLDEYLNTTVKVKINAITYWHSLLNLWK